MKLKITQNQYGQFNILGDEQSTSFSMSLMDDEGKTIEQDGIKARLYYSEEADVREEFEDAIENVQWVFDKCWRYAATVWGSTDYRAQCLLFAKLYQENFNELQTGYIESEAKAIQKEIERLTLKKNQLSLDPLDITDSIEREINKYRSWHESSLKTRAQLIDGSEKAIEEDAKILKYEAKIAELETHLNSTLTSA